MIKAIYTELDGPEGKICRMECSGHAGYAPVGQDIVCAGASTLMQALVYLMAGEEDARVEARDTAGGPYLSVAAGVDDPWTEGAFEMVKAGFLLLAERYPDNLHFMDASERGEQCMLDLQLFAEGGDGGAEGTEASAEAPALSRAQAQQAVASGTMRPGEPEKTAPAAPSAPATAPPPQEPPRPQPPRLPPLPPRVQDPVRSLHARWAAEEAMLRRVQPDFSLREELKNPEMRRLMQMPGMRMQDAYRLAHYNEQLNAAAHAVERGVVERIQQRAARPSENGTRPGGAAVSRADVAHMTRAQREALERQALHGAEIRF
ncbi:MAG: ribosomal-processing cysteine protease Prp [Faecalibacterium sp.]